MADSGGTVSHMHWSLPCLAAGALGGAVGVLTGRALARSARPAPVPVAVCAAGTALLWVLVAVRWSGGALPGWWLPLPLLGTALAVPLTAADVTHRRLPDVLTLPAYPAAALAAAVAAVAGPGAEVLGASLTGAALFLGAHALVRAVGPAGVGAGDVKLSGSLGALLGGLGWPALVVTAVAAAALTALLAGASRAGEAVSGEAGSTGPAAPGASRARARHPTAVPHGPGLLAATCLVLLFPGSALDGVP